MLFLEELGHILLRLLGHQRGILIIETNVLRGSGAFCTDYLPDFLPLGLQDLWQDNGFQGTVCFWVMLELESINCISTEAQIVL